MNLVFDGETTIPGHAGRKALIVYLHSGGGAACFGFGAGTLVMNYITTPLANTGIPLPAGQMVTFTAEHNKVFQQDMKLVSDDVATVTYQEIF